MTWSGEPGSGIVLLVVSLGLSMEFASTVLSCSGK